MYVVKLFGGLVLVSLVFVLLPWAAIDWCVSAPLTDEKTKMIEEFYDNANAMITCSRGKVSLADGTTPEACGVLAKNFERSAREVDSRIWVVHKARFALRHFLDNGKTAGARAYASR